MTSSSHFERSGASKACPSSYLERVGATWAGLSSHSERPDATRAGLSGHFERSGDSLARPERPFRAPWQLPGGPERSFRAPWRHPGRPERPFRAPSGSRAVNTDVFVCPDALKNSKARKSSQYIIRHRACTLQRVWANAPVLRTYVRDTFFRSLDSCF